MLTIAPHPTPGEGRRGFLKKYKKKSVHFSVLKSIVLEGFELLCEVPPIMASIGVCTEPKKVQICWTFLLKAILAVCLWAF